MDSQKHEVVASQLIYKFECLEIILSICKSLINNTVFLCFTRRNFKSKAVYRDDGSEWPSSEYNFFLPRDVGRKLLEELPATIDFIKHVLTKEVKNPSVGYFTTICERLLASSEHREYYIGIKQSNQFGSYQIYISRHNLDVQPTKVTDFSLTHVRRERTRRSSSANANRRRRHIRNLKLLWSLKRFHSNERRLTWYDVLISCFSLFSDGRQNGWIVQGRNSNYYVFL